MNLIVCSIYTYYFLVESIFQQSSYGSNFGKHRKDEFAIFWVEMYISREYLKMVVLFMWFQFHISWFCNLTKN